MVATAVYLYVANGSSATPLFIGERLDGARPSPTLERIRAVVGEGSVRLDEQTIEQILTAFELPNDGEARLASPVGVWQFLRRHEGEAVLLVDDDLPVAADPSDGARAQARPERGPWETPAGVSAWREQLAERLVAPDGKPARLVRAVAWGIGLAVALLVVVSHLLTVSEPGLALATGPR